MSQAGLINFSGGGGPGTPVQTLTGDSGGAVSPTANNINVIGGTSSANTDFGITNIGTPGTSTIAFTLTNRFSGNTTTTDAVPKTLASLDLTTIGTGVFTFDCQIAAFDVTDNEGLGYAIFGTIKNIAGTLSVIGTPDKINNEDIAPVNIQAADASLTTSGTSAIIQVQGLAATTIHWRAVVTYVYVG